MIFLFILVFQIFVLILILIFCIWSFFIFEKRILFCCCYFILIRFFYQFFWIFGNVIIQYVYKKRISKIIDENIDQIFFQFNKKIKILIVQIEIKQLFQISIFKHKFNYIQQFLQIFHEFRQNLINFNFYRKSNVFDDLFSFKSKFLIFADFIVLKKNEVANYQIFLKMRRKYSKMILTQFVKKIVLFENSDYKIRDKNIDKFSIKKRSRNFITKQQKKQIVVLNDDDYIQLLNVLKSDEKNNKNAFFVFSNIFKISNKFSKKIVEK